MLLIILLFQLANPVPTPMGLPPHYPPEPVPSASVSAHGFPAPPIGLSAQPTTIPTAMPTPEAH